MSTATRDDASPDFGILLNLAFGAFKERLHDHLAAAGFADLGGSFGYVIRTLASAEQGLSLKQLSMALGVTPQGTLKIVEDMIAKGYVVRSADPADSRVTRLRLGARGRQLLTAARKFHSAFEKGLAAKHGARAVANTRAVLQGLLDPGAASIGTSARMQLL